jgi:ribA/ribD-fused uncharacterized protein
VFSQWHFSDFEIDGIVFPTAEHWMMLNKARLMGDSVAENAILRDMDTGSPMGTPDPARAKKIGRQVKNWDEAKWEKHCFEIVVEGNVAKFSQDDDLRKFLLGTGDMVLVEASPHDKVWGIGLRREEPESKNPLKWKGKNLLGFAIMEARADIRGESL